MEKQAGCTENRGHCKYMPKSCKNQNLVPVETDADFKQHAVHVDFEALLLRCSVAVAIPQKAEMHKELAKQKEDGMVM